MSDTTSRYFSTKVTVTFKQKECPDEFPDLSYLTQSYSDVTDESERAKYIKQDADRLAAYHRGEWEMIGIRAEATITVTHWSVANGGRFYSTVYTLHSAGLWGIESDSGEAYFDEVYREERESLMNDIKAFGSGNVEFL